ncbi:hypothetical protein G6F57_002183 [Rhizopus arrhizus]|uniref:Integral membrane protein n=1 Tax=Rhizopus oryzae TaxID=64495 RepID=A0A9P7BRS0_RHIOR|nr:hypothetical protein G6F23_003291 [Rhizopus arrhizus]KAG1414929.1 hypothetical protein G6F58_006715 [Rhizopus delemar]KAG0780468.1 hypothetical protein G6F22_010070 [Rhizopus arrhizus]KAG0788849.1 hypothetical protein G6F21_006927 [Rhizopus arrhizus]KAG0815189.1 hypothetical protein G6F20_004179 [Rhizopus arrhizus]
MTKLFYLSILLLFFSQYVLAQHGHTGMVMNETVPAFNATGDEPMSYALYPGDKAYFYLHVSMMVLSFWILMPLGIMFGIAKSSLHVPTQLLAFAVAMLGFFFAKLYGHSTPHLYKGNSHHTLGWIMFLLLIIQMVVGIVRKIANAVARSKGTYEQLESAHLMHSSSSSTADGHASSSSSTRSKTSGETLRMNEFDHDKHHLVNYEEDEDEEMCLSPTTLASVDENPGFTMRLFNAVSPFIPKFVKTAFVALADNSFTNVVCRYYHLMMGRTFILLIFTQTLSGLVVYHGVCRSWEVLGCIAHLIKGGIFFFYGMITFGRYLGAFAERGWAWNHVPNGSSFSFEMVESGLIFTYGITNTWMEHFGQDPEWTHKDFEHASLAFMWWWCGLIGVLVESKALRRLLEGTGKVREEKKQTYSLNPFPALTVFMTGISMGNHHQDTAYSSNIHWLWGLLLSSAAVSRLATYVILYRNAPSEKTPSRPPTELVGAFLLIAGSILFMASNSGTLLWLRRNNVDSMFLMNVVVALTSITLSYVAALMIIKAWAKRREDSKRQH